MTKQNQSNGSIGSIGVFTYVAHRFSWLTALLATGIGLVLIAGGFFSGSDENFFIGWLVVLGGWVGAAGLGTLAEISIKISKLGGDG